MADVEKYDVEQLQAKIDALTSLVESLHARSEEQMSAFQSRFPTNFKHNFPFELLMRRLYVEIEDRDRDIMQILQSGMRIPPCDLEITAERSVAYDTNDHLYPRGTLNDNTRHPRFVKFLEQIIPHPIRHMDIGCAGGGLVWDFTIRGHLSVGVEGSDLSRKMVRAEWRSIPDRLFTADVRYPFHFSNLRGEKQLFDVISAWELLEHIPEADVKNLLKNVKSNLVENGLFIASVATFGDADEDGHHFHATVRDKAWWIAQLEESGFVEVSEGFGVADFVRGSGNPRTLDWHATAMPDFGFHIVVRSASSQPDAINARPGPNSDAVGTPAKLNEDAVNQSFLRIITNKIMGR